jgi:cohesin loading factor subunit SCC2
MKRSINPKALQPNSKPIMFRVLFTLGLLCKHFDVEAPEFAEFNLCTREDIFQAFLYFIKNFDVETQQKALFGLGMPC